MAGGRPSIYTDELADRICELVATNTDGLPKLCAEHDWMPGEETIRIWRFRNLEFAGKYAQAKRFQAELMAEQVKEIAAEKAYYIDAEGNQKVDPGFVASQRLQADTVKWLASKLAPKIYGDRQTIEQTVTVKHEDALKELE